MKIWTVWHGGSAFIFYTEYHAEQYCRALALNGTKFTLTAGEMQ